MAILHFLTRGFSQSLGPYTGWSTRDGSYIRPKMKRISPPLPVQTECVRAFECLNRLASGLAKNYWSLLNLSDLKMLKHNAVAQWLKPLVSNHSFVPENFLSLISKPDIMSIRSITHPYPGSPIFVRLSLYPLFRLPLNTAINIFVLDSIGNMGSTLSITPPLLSLELFPPAVVVGALSVLAFLSSKTKRKSLLFAGCYKLVP